MDTWSAASAGGQDKGISEELGLLAYLPRRTFLLLCLPVFFLCTAISPLRAYLLLQSYLPLNTSLLHQSFLQQL